MAVSLVDTLTKTGEVFQNTPTLILHFCFPCGTKNVQRTFPRLLPVSGKGEKTKHCTLLVVLVLGLALMIYYFIAIPIVIKLHTAILGEVINFLQVTFKALTKRETCLLVSTIFQRQKSKYSTENCQSVIGFLLVLTGKHCFLTFFIFQTQICSK